MAYSLDTTKIHIRSQMRISRSSPFPFESVSISTRPPLHIRPTRTNRTYPDRLVQIVRISRPSSLSRLACFDYPFATTTFYTHHLNSWTTIAALDAYIRDHHCLCVWLELILAEAWVVLLACFCCLWMDGCEEMVISFVDGILVVEE